MRALFIFLLLARVASAEILVAGAGDSIMEGYIYHTTAIAGGGVDSGNLGYDPMWQLKTNFSGIAITNYGYPAWRWDQVVSGSLPMIVALRPTVAIFHCGVNDIHQSRTWNQTLAQLNIIKTNLDAAGIFMVLDQIYPDTNFDDAKSLTIRTWNSNYVEWASASNVVCITSHDSMGQIRISTGELDDLRYNQGDGVHISASGVLVMATNFYNAVSRWIPVKRTTNTRTLNVGRIVTP